MIVAAPVACSCSNRAWLIRRPSSCSSNSSPPPAPQQKGLLPVALRLQDARPDPLEQFARLLHVAGVAGEVARVVQRDVPRSARQAATSPGSATAARRSAPPRPRNRAAGSRAPSVFRQCGQAVRIFFTPAAWNSAMFAAPAPGTCTRCRSAWPGRPCTVPSPSTPKVTPRRAQDVEERPQRLLEVGIVRARAARATSGTRGATRRRSRGPRTATNFCRWSDGQPPDVAAALEVVVHRAERVGRLAVRHQAAPRADDERQVLDADRALLPRTRRTSCTATARWRRRRRPASRRASRPAARPRCRGSASSG